MTFETVRVGPPAGSTVIRDDDPCVGCDDERVELAGTLTVIGAGERSLDWYGDTGSPVDRGAPSTVASIPLGGPGGCPAGTTCFEGSGRSEAWGAALLSSVSGRPPAAGNQRVVVGVRNAGSLTIRSDIRDVGPLRDGDPWCQTQVELPARSLEQWASSDEAVVLRDDRGEAACEITARVRGLGTRGADR